MPSKIIPTETLIAQAVALATEQCRAMGAPIKKQELLLVKIGAAAAVQIVARESAAAHAALEAQVTVTE